MELQSLCMYLDDLLDIGNTPDQSQNGLQVENSGKIDKIAVAVDASLASFEKAGEAGANFLFVHHGLIWNKPVKLTGANYHRLRFLFQLGILLRHLGVLAQVLRRLSFQHH